MEEESNPLIKYFLLFFLKRKLLDWSCYCCSRWHDWWGEREKRKCNWKELRELEEKDIIDGVLAATLGLKLSRILRLKLICMERNKINIYIYIYIYIYIKLL